MNFSFSTSKTRGNRSFDKREVTEASEFIIESIDQAPRLIMQNYVATYTIELIDGTQLSEMIPLNPSTYGQIDAANRQYFAAILSLSMILNHLRSRKKLGKFSFSTENMDHCNSRIGVGIMISMASMSSVLQQKFTKEDETHIIDAVLIRMLKPWINDLSEFDLIESITNKEIAYKAGYSFKLEEKVLWQETLSSSVPIKNTIIAILKEIDPETGILSVIDREGNHRSVSALALLPKNSEIYQEFKDK